MHFANLKKSKRLQRLKKYLSDRIWHSTMDIVYGADVCAVNSAVAELRCNGVPVVCRSRKIMCDERIFEYRMK